MTYPYKEKEKPLLKGIFDWFVKNDFGFKPVDTNAPRRHFHSWEFYNTIRLGWRIEEGHPVGSRVGINIAILDVEKCPSKNETKASQLYDWRKAGFEFVHTSQTMYRCKSQNCSVIKTIDAYVAPVKGDGSGPMVIDIGSQHLFQKKFTETTGIPVGNVNASNNRREVSIEPMKRYGIRPKQNVPDAYHSNESLT